ncbi:hypothetical protein OAP83_00965 [Rickettsiales bacterium]|nr:hypothetical protein [Rickettsiales bacterium]
MERIVLRLASLFKRKLLHKHVEHKNASKWYFKWFCQNGFTVEDKMRILKGYYDVHYDKCSILVVYSSCIKHLGHIKRLAEKQDLNIVGDFNLSFDSIVSFRNITYDIYDYNNIRDKKDTYINIGNKIDILTQMESLELQIILVEGSKKNIFEKTKLLKSEVSNLMDHMMPKNIFCTMHASDSLNESKFLSQTLLSPNNINNLKMRLCYKFSDHFLSLCRDLKEACKKQKIKLNDICVIGSAPLSVMGIKEVSDIDFITLVKYRKIYGDKPVPIYKEVDLASKQYHRTSHGTAINDDNLVQNDENHFMFMGIKFANLDIIRDRKSLQKREKDLRHVRMIDIFQNTTNNSQRQILLNRKIIEEQRRRLEKKEQKNNINFKVVLIKTEYMLVNMICCIVPSKALRKKIRIAGISTINKYLAKIITSFILSKSKRKILRKYFNDLSHYQN